MKSFLRVLGVVLLSGGLLIMALAAKLGQATAGYWVAVGAGLWCVSIAAILDRLEQIAEELRRIR